MSGRSTNAASERRPLLPNGPPPPYHHVVNPPEVNGRYTPISKPVTAKFFAGNRKSLFLAIGSLAIVAILAPFLWIQVQKYNQCANIPDAAERARIVLEWQKERDAFAFESHGWEDKRMAWREDERHHQKELAEWQSERIRREGALRQWERQERFNFEVEMGRARRAFEAEKHGWDESRKEWTEERERRVRERAREMGGMWDAPQGEECHAYNLRQYSVRLDAHAVCKIAPITVKDHIMMAETCEVQNGQVVGRYKTSGDSFCQFQWNGMHDKQCTTRGQASGTRTFEARLWGLHRDRRENWQEMCNTTPASLHGLYFSRPTRCIQDKDGMSGEFDFDDPTCTWNDLRNSLKETS